MNLLPVVFEEREIRRVYDEKTETWFFSVVVIIQVLTQQPDYQASRKYWKVLKGRLAKEGSELVTNCYQLKMAADDAKQRLTKGRTAIEIAVNGLRRRAVCRIVRDGLGRKGGERERGLRVYIKALL